MKNLIFVVMMLLLVAAGCITIDTGGGANAKPAVVKFTVSPTSIGPGEAAILSWEVQNASSVSIDPGIPAAASAGAEKVAPAATTTYILTATNKAGSTRSTVLLTIAGTGGIPPAPASGLPVISSFTASPASISPGGFSVLNWTTSNATGAKISGIGNVGTSGSTSVNPMATTTYVLEATNGPNSTSAYTTVAVGGGTVTPPPYVSSPAILSFTASPASVTLGGATVLSWTTLDATSASISSYGVPAVSVPVTGTLTVYPSNTGNSNFILTATNSSGSNTASAPVVVTSGYTPPPSGSVPTASLYVAPSSITSGNSATVSWMTSGASSISINNGVKNLLGVSGATGSISVSPSFTTTYTLTATNAYGSTYSSQVLTVTAAPIPYIPLYGSPPAAALYLSTSNIASGESSTLSWETSGATSIVIDNGVKSLAGISGASGSVSVSPTSTTTYTLTATNSYGSSHASKVLTVRFEHLYP